MANKNEEYAKIIKALDLAGYEVLELRSNVVDDERQTKGGGEIRIIVFPMAEKEG